MKRIHQIDTTRAIIAQCKTCYKTNVKTQTIN